MYSYISSKLDKILFSLFKFQSRFASLLFILLYNRKLAYPNDVLFAGSNGNQSDYRNYNRNSNSKLKRITDDTNGVKCK